MEREDEGSVSFDCRKATMDDEEQVARVFAYENGLHVGLQPDIFVRLGEEEILAGDWLRSVLEDEASSIVLAHERGKVVGLVYFSIVPSGSAIYKEERMGIVNELVVLPQYQGMGVGRMLMDHVEDVARRAGVNLVRLHVWENNAAALAFYHSLGYESRQRVMWKRV